MPEPFAGFDTAFVDMCCGEIQALGGPRGKSKGHRMDATASTPAQLKHRKSIVDVAGQLAPHVLRQPKSCVEPVKVSLGGDKRSLERADAVYLEFGPREPQSPGFGLGFAIDQESRSEIHEKSWIGGKVDK